MYVMASSSSIYRWRNAEWEKLSGVCSSVVAGLGWRPTFLAHHCSLISSVPRLKGQKKFWKLFVLFFFFLALCPVSLCKMPAHTLVVRGWEELLVMLKQAFHVVGRNLNFPSFCFPGYPCFLANVVPGSFGVILDFKAHTFSKCSTLLPQLHLGFIYQPISPKVWLIVEISMFLSGWRLLGV